jgi:hypothetical protein
VCLVLTCSFSVTEMLVAVLNTCSKEELEGEDVALPAINLREEERRQALQNTIMAVGRMSRVFSLLRSVPFLVHLSSCSCVFGKIAVRSRRGVQS